MTSVGSKPVRPGWRTSEFWLSAAAALMGLAHASGILEQTATDWDNKIVGLATAGLVALGYNVARTIVKTK